MSIKDVIHIRRMLHIYNEAGRLTGSINAFDGLIEFSADFVKVSRMDRVLIYDEHGILRATPRKQSDLLESELLPNEPLLSSESASNAVIANRVMNGIILPQAHR